MSNCFLFTFLVLSCVLQSAIGMFLMWRTTRAPKEQGPQLLKRDIYLPPKLEHPSFSDNMYIDPSDFGIRIGRKRRSSPTQKKLENEQSAYEVNPLDFGISFGKRSNELEDWSIFGTNFGKRSVNTEAQNVPLVDPINFGISFGK